MKIRLMGTKTELEVAVEKLKAEFVVVEVSGFYQNRGDSSLGRIYIETRWEGR